MKAYVIQLKHACQCITRERKHIGSMSSRVTCLDSLLVAAQTLARRAPVSYRCRQRLTIETVNKQYKQININSTPNCT
jgi:hypothetical protein